jgi:phosphonate transport system ATP-binding protein
MLGKLGKINPLRSWIGGFTDEEALKALDALREVKMGDFAERLTGSLSGGEAQRVAIARAIFQEPALYIADEPISSLDPKNAKSIMKLLRPLADDHPVLGVFHQPDMVAKYCTRAIGLKGGRIVYDGDPRLSHEKLMEIYGEELEEIEQQQGVAKEPEKLADEAGDKQHFREGKEAKIAG